MPGVFIHLKNLDHFLLKKDLELLKRKKRDLLICIPASCGIKSFSYLFYLFVLKSSFKKLGLKEKAMFFLYPSFAVPCDRKVFCFVEKEFYPRSQSRWKFFLKRIFLRIFGYVFCRHPLMVVFDHQRHKKLSLR